MCAERYILILLGHLRDRKEGFLCHGGTESAPILLRTDTVILNGTKWSEGSVTDSSLTLSSQLHVSKKNVG